MILKNNFKLNTFMKYLIILSIFSTLLITTKIISYKIVYFFQITSFFFLAYFFKILKIQKIFYLNLIILTIFLFNYNREMIYLITLCLFTSFINFKKLNFKKLDIEPKYLILYFGIAFYFLQSYNTNLNILKAMENKNFFPTCCYRMEYFLLNANLTSVLLLIVAIFFLQYLNKIKFLIFFSLTAILILILTSSKSGTLFFIFYFLITIIRISKVKMFIIFILLNFFLILSSIWLVKNFDNPYVGKNRIEQVQVYNKFCTSFDSKIIKYLSNCVTEGYNEKRQKEGLYLKTYLPKNNILNIFGMSSYYKFYTFGLTIDNIKKNYKYFIFPNGLNKLIDEDKIQFSQIKNDFAAHSFILQSIHKFGFTYFIIFLVNLYYLTRMYKNIEIFTPFLISSTFLSVDIMLFFPLIIMQIYLSNNYMHRNVS